MRFEYNGNLTYDERVLQVSKEITDYYKDIKKNEAFLIASLEDPITTDVTSVIKFKRLYNILFVIQNKKDIFDRVYKDLEDVFKEYTLSNIEDKKIDRIMEEVIKYKNKKRLDFPTINEFY